MWCCAQGKGMLLLLILGTDWSGAWLFISFYGTGMLRTLPQEGYVRLKQIANKIVGT